MSAPDPSQQKFASLVPDALKQESEPVFAEPWQAQAFAMTIALHQSGLFSWDDWASTLGAVIGDHRDQDDRSGGRYYEFWLAALEQIVAQKGAADAAGLSDLKAAWAQAYRDTPHGTPVVLPDA